MKNHIRKTVDELRPMDDILFHKLSENRNFCEELLRCILNKPDLIIIENIPQRSLKNIHGRSVILDLLCQDAEHNYYNVELQRSNQDNHQRRVRYNGASIDTFIMEKGSRFKELPDVYVVYISDFDIFKGGKTCYCIKRSIHETDEVVCNGFHEIYINAENDDGSEIAALMSIFQSTDMEYDSRFPGICDAIRYYRRGKGRGVMCEAVEKLAKEYAEEKIIQIAKNMIKNGFDLDSIAENTGLPKNRIMELIPNQ